MRYWRNRSWDEWTKERRRKAIQQAVEIDTFRLSPEPVVKIVNAQNCEPCHDEACLNLCPANVFQPNQNRPGGIEVHAEQCLECGACVYFCGKDNIRFDYPPGGYGVIHQYG